MTLTTSPRFASAAASGTDWRDTAKTVLEQLEKAITRQGQFTIGFLYITDLLAEDAKSILTLFRSVTGIDNWIGCTGMGVCAAGQEYIDVPAISAMIGTVDPEHMRLFPAITGSKAALQEILQSWPARDKAMLVIAHGDPRADIDPAQSLSIVAGETGGFVVGGLSSSRGGHALFSKDVMNGGLCGAVLSGDVQASTALSQGCRPMGKLHAVTRAHGTTIMELDGRAPMQVFQDDIRAFVIHKTGQDPDKVMVEDGARGGHALHSMPREFQDLLRGEVHVAFPVSGSDRQDYMVRNIIGMDAEDGHLSVAHHVVTGDHILFAHRDEETIREELSLMLTSFRDRVQRERGDFKPTGGVFISCAGRAYPALSGENEGGGSGEMAMVRSIIGDIPVTGFYAAGEISGNRLYGYTGILILFF